MTIRKATTNDAAYLAEACIGIVQFMRQGNTDKFILGFPDKVTVEMIDWANQYTGAEDKVAFIAERPDGQNAGCILGEIAQSNVPMSVPGKVGVVFACWVEPGIRRSGIGRRLLVELESWFAAQDVHHLEVAFMDRNDTAKEAWAHLGFSPFRVFAYKDISEQAGGAEAAE